MRKAGNQSRILVRKISSRQDDSLGAKTLMSLFGANILIQKQRRI